MLARLRRLAGRCGAAFIGVSDLRESAGTKAAAGAVPATARALMSAARSVWMVSCDPEDPQRRLFMPGKNNLAAPGPGYAWRLAGGKVQWEVAARGKARPAGPHARSPAGGGVHRRLPQGRPEDVERDRIQRRAGRLQAGRPNGCAGPLPPHSSAPRRTAAGCGG